MKKRGSIPRKKLPMPDLILKKNIAQKESSRIVAISLAHLPPKYREVVWLCKIQELNVTDTAENLGIQVGTVKARMHRARRMITRYMNDRMVSQAARLRSARRLGILTPYGDAVPRTSTTEHVGVKRTRQETSSQGLRGPRGLHGRAIGLPETPLRTIHLRLQ